MVEFLDKRYYSLRSRADGSCIFLQHSKEKNIYECLIYDSRPILCRLYPFHFEQIHSDSFLLKLMPCLGINRRCGELVDTKFIITHVGSFINSV